MSHISEFLTADHGACDHAFIEAEASVAQGQWNQAKDLLQRFCFATQRHFRREEQVLFPAFEAATGQAGGPTEIMRSEHEQMRQILEALQQALREKNREKFLGEADTLLSLMQQHNLKEENILYRMADQLLARQSDLLLEQMQIPEPC